jgi:hypothetical protein
MPLSLFLPLHLLTSPCLTPSSYLQMSPSLFLLPNASLPLLTSPSPYLPIPPSLFLPPSLSLPPNASIFFLHPQSHTVSFFLSVTPSFLLSLSLQILFTYSITHSIIHSFSLSLTHTLLSLLTDSHSLSQSISPSESFNLTFFHLLYHSHIFSVTHSLSLSLINSATFFTHWCFSYSLIHFQSLSLPQYHSLVLFFIHLLSSSLFPHTLTITNSHFLLLIQKFLFTLYLPLYHSFVLFVFLNHSPTLSSYHPIFPYHSPILSITHSCSLILTLSFTHFIYQSLTYAHLHTLLSQSLTNLLPFFHFFILLC